MADKRDWHGAFYSYRRGFYSDVTLLHDDRNIPLYVSLFDPTWAVCVEGLPKLVWAVAASSREEGPRLYGEIVEMIAYWIWQLGPHVEGLVSRVPVDPLICWVHVEDPAKWNEPVAEERDNSREGAREQEGVTWAASPNEGSVTLRLFPQLLALLSSADNSGERRIVGALISALRDLVAELGGSVEGFTSADQIQGVIDACAPLGFKKKLMILNTARSPELDDFGLPRYRRVHPYEEGRVLDPKRGVSLQGIINQGQFRRISSSTSLIRFRPVICTSDWRR